MFYDEFQDIFTQHQGDIGHTKLIAMDMESGDHPIISHKSCMLPLKHNQWVKEELEMCVTRAKSHCHST